MKIIIAGIHQVRISKEHYCFIDHHFLCLQNEENKIFVFVCVGKEKASGNVGVQGWNGELGRWMVAGRFTGLQDKFPTLEFFSKLDFGLSVVST